ncbi:hypothetical protein DFS34DRAFT_653019 [Phlyctochytrium arcticum]|nr:hypothetical protein DFS34DRAFT_653019 [Phlyctochytrium arcticum]
MIFLRRAALTSPVTPLRGSRTFVATILRQRRLPAASESLARLGKRSRSATNWRIPYTCNSCRKLATKAEHDTSDATVLQSLNTEKAEVLRLLGLVKSQRQWQKLREEQSALQQEVQSDSLWQDDANAAIKYQKRLSRLDETLKEHDGYVNKGQELLDLLDLAEEENDYALIQDVAQDLLPFRSTLEKYSLRLLMAEEADKNGCFLEIRAGAGGVESCDWVSILGRMYQRWGASEGHTVKAVDEVRGDVAGLKSATLQISGEYVYGWCKHEAGVHRFVRVSPFDANGKRHTSFVSVQVYPAFDAEGSQDGKNMEIPPGDLRVDVMRAQGAGGQHVNTTESAVRMVHLPTGITVSCQNERSQHQNRAVALQMIQAKLYERELRAQAQAKAEHRAELAENAWGSQIRSYVLQPYKMIKDARTGYERGDVDRVLDGDLNGFMEAALVHLGKK